MNQRQKEILCKSIKSRRKKLNLTQEALADRLGYTKQAISNWETGKNMPSDEDIEKLTQILGIRPDDLQDNEKLRMSAKDLEFIEIYPIPNKVFTYALFFRDNVNSQYRAWIHDMDYPTMVFAGYACSKCDDYVSFKEDLYEHWI